MIKKFTLLLLAMLCIAGSARADVEWTIWEGTASSENNYTPLFSIPQDIITSLDEGDFIYATFTKKNENNDGNWRINWNSIQHINGFDYANGIISVEITSTLKNQVGGTASYTKYEWNAGTSSWDESSVTQAGDLKIQGSSFTLTKVAIKKKTSMIKTSVWTGTQNIVYWNGLGLTAGKFSGIANNDYIYAKAKRHTDAVTYTDSKSIEHENETPTYWSFQLQDWSSESEKYTDVDIPLYEATTGTWVKITSDADKIASHAAGATGFCCDLTEIDYYHPITSFSIGSIGLATFCADVAVNIPDGINAYWASVSGDFNNVILTKITDGKIPANTGVIIEGAEGSVVEFTTTETATTYPSNILVGVTHDTDMTEGDFVLYNAGGTAEFRKVTATTLKANKAYIPKAEVTVAPSRGFGIEIGDGTTSINKVVTEQKTDSEGIFNLSGQRVNQPSKGIYIVNGKKMIFK